MVREIASKKTQAQASDTTSRFPVESTIQYTSFNLQPHTLHAYSGKYVRWALPDSWLGSDGFSPQEVRQLVDLGDLVYAYMAEIVRGEPVGQGLVTVAVVDVDPPAAALGRVGFKGIEISPGVLADVKANLALGMTSGYFNHELAHNFDIYRNYLSYYGDWGHAWTNFFDPSFIRFYSRMGSIDFAPENVLTESLSNALKSWDAAGQNATWAKCVRNGGGCEADGITANDAWAIFLVRFARLHGPSSVTRAFQFLSDYKANNNPIPVTPEDKNDLLVRALAFGAGVNIGCEIDAWRWTLSAKAQGDLSVSFPDANPFCIDNDGDNFTEVQGDFDDHKPLVHPGAVEVINNIDDDCNGYFDDILLNENQDFASNNPPTVSLPVRITGNTANRDDWDFFNLAVPSARRFDVRLSSAGTFGGWLQRLDPFTTMLFTDPNKIVYGHFILTPGEYALAVIPQDNKTGNYEVVISEHSQSNPVSLSVTPGITGHTVHITATVNTSLVGNQQPTSIRFWADGIGFFRTVPFAQSTSIDWVTPPEGGQVGLRAQLLTQGSPITAATDPLFVQTEARPLYSLSGQITEDGSALAGVTLMMTGSTTATTQTAFDGKYSFTMLEAGGTYTLTPTKVNYTFTPATQTINNLNANQKIDFTGTFQRYSINGRVTLNNVGLGAVTVMLAGSETRSATTDASGNYSFPGLRAGGNFTVTPFRTNFSFTPLNQVVNNLSIDTASDFAARINAGVPILLSEENSTRGLALDSVLRQSEPFQQTYQHAWSIDRRTRIMLFATNFELASNETATAVSADAEDVAHIRRSLPVEYVGKAPGFDWLNCIIVRLDVDVLGDVLVQIKYRGISSNRVRIGVGHVGGGPPDDPGAFPTPGRPPQ